MHSAIHRRLLSIAFLGLALVAACSPAASTAPAPTTAPATPSDAAAPAETTVWLPDWADAATPDAVRTRRPLPFCGVERAPAPQPMEHVDEAVRLCFWNAAQAKRAAEWVSVQGTIEGAAIATIYRLLEDGSIEVLSDFTQDPLGGGGWSRAVCAEVVEGEGDSLVGVADCEETEPLH